MDKKTVLEIADRFHKEMVIRGIRPNKLILFGSYAQGKNTEDSDIDLIVVSDDFTGKNYWERIDILTDAIYQIFAPIEATAFTETEWMNNDSIIANIAQNGEVLYAA